MVKKSFRIVLAFIFFTIFILLALGLPSKKVLSIYNRKQPGERYFVDAKNLNGFEISYTHSVNKGRVHDFYDTHSRKKDLILTSTRFVSYGAGIPEPEETPGAVFTVTDNGYIISNLERVVPKLTMAVGLIAEHEIAFMFNLNGKEQIETYTMKALFKPQTSIILEKKRVSLINYIFHKL